MNSIISVIIKRSKTLAAVSESTTDDVFTQRYLDNAVKSIGECLENGKLNSNATRSINLLYDHFREGQVNHNAYCLEMLQMIDRVATIDGHVANQMSKRYVDEILPHVYTESLQSIKEQIKRYETDLTIVKEGVDQYLAADRILKNHKMISERFNCDILNENIHRKNFDYVCEDLCSILDTYDLKNYQKANIVIEEMGYLLDRNGYSWVGDKEASRKYIKKIVEYFVLSPYMDGQMDITPEEVKGFTQMAKTSFYVKEVYNDLVAMYEMFDPEIVDSNDFVADAILHREKFNTICDYAKLASRKESVEKFGDILNLLAEVATISKTPEFFEEKMDAYIEGIIAHEDYEDPIGAKDTFKTYILKTENFIKEEMNSISSFSKAFIEKAEEIKETLSEYYDRLYDDDNIKTIRQLQEDGQMLMVHEYAKYNFTNLIKAAFNLKQKINMLAARQSMRKLRKKAKRIQYIKHARNVLFGEGMDIYSHIGQDGKADICVDQFFFTEDYTGEVMDMLAEACKSYNDMLNSHNEFQIRAYYVASEGVAEVHVKDMHTILANEDDQKKISEAQNQDLDLYFEFLGEAETVINSDILNSSIDESVKASEMLHENQPFDQEAFDLALEALRYSGADEDILEAFISQCYGDLITEANDIKVEPIDDYIPLSMKLEAYHIFQNVCEEAPVVKKPEVGGAKIHTADSDDKKAAPADKDDKEESGKKKGWGVNLNSIKLAMEGLKSKFKDMSQKEKEVSKNLDNNVAQFVKGMKDAMISDRREAIIKGSVIPSFSKCMKIGIGLAGLTGIASIITGALNPIPAIIVAIGGLAVSKHLTKKERVLLLDDIETELDVVDKEIANAESKNQMKKYRKLLKYKKDLQRQYQRIKYNIRVGKDILPNSSAGIKQTSN